MIVNKRGLRMHKLLYIGHTFREKQLLGVSVLYAGG